MIALSITLDRDEALEIVKALSARCAQAHRTASLADILERFDRFLVGCSARNESLDAISGIVLHGLKPLQVGARGSSRQTLEFELDDRVVNAILDGEIVVTNVKSIVREPGLIRTKDAEKAERTFVTPLKLPYDWNAALLPGRNLAVRSDEQRDAQRPHLGRKLTGCSTRRQTAKRPRR